MNRADRRRGSRGTGRGKLTPDEAAVVNEVQRLCELLIAAQTAGDDQAAERHAREIGQHPLSATAGLRYLAARCVAST